jgi:hypothetical protein
VSYGIFCKHFDIAFIASVEENRPRVFVPRRLIDQVAHFERRIAGKTEMIHLQKI